MKHNSILLPLLFCTLSLSAQLKENLGENINSEYVEVHPCISPDGQTLYFAKGKYPGNKGKKDIFYSTLKEDGTWSKARSMGSGLNNSSENVVIGVSSDNNQLLLFWNYDGSGARYSRTVRDQYGWTKPVGLVFEGSKKFEGNLSGSLASDGRTVIMQLTETGKNAKGDIYVGWTTEDGKITEPLNLGPVINCPESDMTPFLSSDLKTLYFSSTREGGYGGADIYMSKRIDDTWTNWTEPKNLGRLVNTASWDLYFCVPYNGEYAYFSSGEDSYGMDDIFRVKLPEEFQPEKTLLIKGRTLNKKTMEPVSADIRYKSLTGGKDQGSLQSAPGTGEYRITVSKGDVYGFHANAKNYYSIAENIDLRELEESSAVEKDIFLLPLEEGEIILLNNIFFDTGSSDLKTESENELARLAKLLVQYPDMEIEIGGHTDNVGDNASNQKLSQQRASSVMDKLIKNGIKAKRLTAKGFGEQSPVASNETEEGRQANRRVEFRIIKMS